MFPADGRKDGDTTKLTAIFTNFLNAVKPLKQNAMKANRRNVPERYV